MLFPFEDSVICVFIFQINRQGFPPIVCTGLLVEKCDDGDLCFQPIQMGAWVHTLVLHTHLKITSSV